MINTKGLRGDIRSEWDELKQHDVLFLMTVRPHDTETLGQMRAEAATAGRKLNAVELYGLLSVRGCEVLEVKDEGGRFMNDFTGGHEAGAPGRQAGGGARQAGRWLLNACMRRTRRC